MHVVVIAHTRFPISQPFAGGLESLTWHLARGLVARGHRVSLFAAPGTERMPGVEHLWPEPLELSAAAQQDVSMPEAGWMQRHHAYLQLMIRLAERTDIDVVHTHALHHLPIAMAPTLATPTVLTLHTPPTPWLESALRVAQSSVHPSSRQPIATAVSHFTAAAWAHLVPAQVVPNGIDTDEWHVGPGGDRLIWSGRIVPEKAPHLAVDIAQEAGMPLTLVGPVSDEAYAREVLWPRCERSGDVSYAGHLRSADLADLVGRHRAALVTPAWDEPYGLVAAEALSCGTPVLALARGGLPEVLGHDVGRLVPVGPQDTEAEIVQRAARLLPEVLGISRSTCREYAVGHLSLDAMVDDYEAVYQRALATSPVPPAGSRRRPVRVVHRPVSARVGSAGHRGRRTDAGHDSEGVVPA